MLRRVILLSAFGVLAGCPLDFDPSTLDREPLEPVAIEDGGEPDAGARAAADGGRLNAVSSGTDAGRASPDAGSTPRPDAGSTPRPDAGQARPDAGTTRRPDASGASGADALCDDRHGNDRGEGHGPGRHCEGDGEDDDEDD